jgi:hypothetical protein
MSLMTIDSLSDVMINKRKNSDILRSTNLAEKGRQIYLILDWE